MEQFYLLVVAYRVCDNSTETKHMFIWLERDESGNVHWCATHHNSSRVFIWPVQQLLTGFGNWIAATTVLSVRESLTRRVQSRSMYFSPQLNQSPHCLATTNTSGRARMQFHTLTLRLRRCVHSYYFCRTTYADQSYSRSIYADPIVQSIYGKSLLVLQSPDTQQTLSNVPLE